MKRLSPLRPRRLLTALTCTAVAAGGSAALASADGSTPATPALGTAASSLRTAAQSAPVRGGDVVRLRWSAVPRASGYELIAITAAGRRFVVRPVADVRVSHTRTHQAGAVRAWETTGYQALGYSAGVGHSVTSAGTALLSPLGSVALDGDQRVSASPGASVRLAATRTSAYVQNTLSSDVRYAVAAIVAHRLTPVTHISQTHVGRASAATTATTISVDSGQSYQTIAGFGASLTDASAYELSKGISDPGSSAGQAALEAEPALADLFGEQTGIGLSEVRVSIGGNDFSQADYGASLSLANDYTETDPAPGSTATAFTNAALAAYAAHDLEYEIPVLKAATALNPALKIMAAPWTAPVWMKCENADAESGGACQAFDPTGLQAELSGDPGYAGGTLNPADVPQYADYLLEFILAYRAAGLTVSAVSLGNEPANGTWSYPSMTMTAPIEAAVAATLKADMKAAGVSTEIIGLDDDWSSSATALEHDAAGSLDATGFHCYGGTPAAQDAITTPIEETECSPLGYYTADRDPSLAGNDSTAPANFALDLLWDTYYLEIAGLRDGDSGGVAGAGSQTVMLWNLAADSAYGPTINAGCTAASSAGACLPVEELSAQGSPTFQVGYYILGQLSRFVVPGAVRIGSTQAGGLATVAFRNPDGQLVLLVLNTQPVDCDSLACAAPSQSRSFTVDAGVASFSAAIPAGAVQTYVWNG